MKNAHLDRIRRKLKQIADIADKETPDADELVIQARKLAAAAETYKERMKHK